MIVILSGEGKTDFGQCINAQGICSGDDYQLGAMAIIVDKMLAERMNYSIRETTPDLFLFVSEAALKERDDLRKKESRKVSFAGKKRDQETGYFYINAWMLGNTALEKEENAKDKVIAILFRDCDGTRSSAAGLWEAKWQSMINGFQRSGFNHGVPMLPKPKSEAWLICAAKSQPYQNCDSLESLSGNDDSPNSAKSQLDALLGNHKSAEELSDWMVEKPFDFNACKMPSFLAFKDEFNRVLKEVVSNNL
jgi:hypothetical protein